MVISVTGDDWLGYQDNPSACLVIKINHLWAWLSWQNTRDKLQIEAKNLIQSAHPDLPKILSCLEALTPDFYWVAGTVKILEKFYTKTGKGAKNLSCIELKIDLQAQSPGAHLKKISDVFWKYQAETEDLNDQGRNFEGNRGQNLDKAPE